MKELERITGIVIGNSSTKTITGGSTIYNLTVFTLDTHYYGKINISLYSDYEIQLRDDEYVSVEGRFINNRFVADEVEVLES